MAVQDSRMAAACVGAGDREARGSLAAAVRRGMWKWTASATLWKPFAPKQPAAMRRYEQNPKHKSWLQPFDPDATQCPAWSHARAQGLLDDSLADAGDGRRFATLDGMAFAARITKDDVWHGYPVPWSEVPEAVREALVVAEKMTRRQIKRLLASEALADELDA